MYRWDLQRARALLEHQQLLDKYNKKGSGALMESTVEKKDKIVTFSSKPEDSKAGTCKVYMSLGQVF